MKQGTRGGVLYKLTSPSGKSYIGISSKGLEARWAKHVEHACGKRTAGALYAALRKYGPDSFTRELLAETQDWEELRAMEIAAIRAHGTLAPAGYNITQGGEGTRTRLSVEARANISAAQKLRYQRPGERERLRAAGAIARAASSERGRIRREQRRADRAAYVASQEFKEMHSARVKKALATPAVRAKVLACAAERAASPQWRARISASKSGKKTRPCSEQRKQRIADARRREWADPVIRAKRLAALAIARTAKASKESHG